ncbi:MFS transporter [Streptomyces roseoverticillatus]|uniref:MFS transporter n=1 Tax=Streptomyces roseoverticillatus TaxID=66429 RepID=UPI001F201373|nr:MFS transporter [Streptomyces roseoverticillatus]MCF3099994.1 MFS transporter [Streptomyces roseoverticillatus]
MTAGQRKIAFVVCLTTMLLAVLDQNIVSAVTVPIVRDLDPAHGIDRVPWLISAFALASTAALPLYGKLCDTLGARKVFLSAVAAFLVGSALCGAAQSMEQLIAFRAVQGIGGGGLMSVTMVVIAQLRAAAPADGSDGGGKGGAGIGGLVAGAGMALGPLLGGVLADHADWRWVFYVNLPVGLAVLAAAAAVLKLPQHHGARHRIDFLGAGLAAAFSTAVLLVAEWGGKEYAWGSPVVLGLIAASALLLGLFLWRQATAAEPVLPLSLFKIPVLRISFALQALIGTALMGSMIYVIIYLQLVRGIAATNASLFLLPMAAGISVIGVVTGRLTARGWSQKIFVVAGTAVSAAAMGILATLSADTGLWVVGTALLLLGLGFGQLLGQLIQLAQESAPPRQLGVATTGIRFFQSLGGALGASLFGTVLARVYEAKGPGGSASRIAALSGEAHTQAIRAFVSSVDTVFACAAGAMLLALLLAIRLRVPRP